MNVRAVIFQEIHINYIFYALAIRVKDYLIEKNDIPEKVILIRRIVEKKNESKKNFKR